MGYQESWLLVSPRDFDKAIQAYIMTVKSGYYDYAGAEPQSIILLKQPFGELPEGSLLLWVCGDRCFHSVEGIFDNNLCCPGEVIPVENVLQGPGDERLEGIDLKGILPTENDYMQRFSIVDYAMKQQQKDEFEQRVFPSLGQPEGTDGHKVKRRGIREKFFAAAIRSEISLAARTAPSEVEIRDKITR